jgi:hypothetical protein
MFYLSFSASTFFLGGPGFGAASAFIVFAFEEARAAAFFWLAISFSVRSAGAAFLVAALVATTGFLAGAFAVVGLAFEAGLLAGYFFSVVFSNLAGMF